MSHSIDKFETSDCLELSNFFKQNIKILKRGYRKKPETFIVASQLYSIIEQSTLQNSSTLWKGLFIFSYYTSKTQRKGKFVALCKFENKR